MKNIIWATIIAVLVTIFAAMGVLEYLSKNFAIFALLLWLLMFVFGFTILANKYEANKLEAKNVTRKKQNSAGL